MQLLGIKKVKETSRRVGEKMKQAPFVIQLLPEVRHYLKIIDRQSRKTNKVLGNSCYHTENFSNLSLIMPKTYT